MEDGPIIGTTTWGVRMKIVGKETTKGYGPIVSLKDDRDTKWSRPLPMIAIGKWIPDRNWVFVDDLEEIVAKYKMEEQDG